MRNATFHVSAAAVLLLTLAACGGSGPPTSGRDGVTPTQSQPSAAGAATVAPATVPANVPTTGSSGADACALLTVEEVSAAYGDTLETAVPMADDQYSYCDYGADREVRIYVAKSPGTSQGVFNTMKINDGEAVSGVGDEAYWSTDSFAPGLYFLKGGLLAFISGAQTGPEDSIVQLGALLASRM